MILIGTDDACRLPRLILLQHAVVDHVELIVKHDVAVDLLDDVVLDEDEAVHFDVDREAVGVEARAYLLVDLDEDVVCRLLYRPLAVLLGDRVDELQLFEGDLGHEIVEGARVDFLCIGVDEVFQVLTVCELRKAEVNDFIHELIYQHEVGAQQLFLNAAAEVVDSLKHKNKLKAFTPT